MAAYAHQITTGTPGFSDLTYSPDIQVHLALNLLMLSIIIHNTFQGRNWLPNTGWAISNVV